jgi:hypothetical protein
MIRAKSGASLLYGLYGMLKTRQSDCRVSGRLIPTQLYLKTSAGENYHYILAALKHEKYSQNPAIVPTLERGNADKSCFSPDILARRAYF